MAYQTNYTGADQGNNANTPKDKDNRKVIYGILIFLLLGTWAFLIFDKTRSTQIIDQQQVSLTSADSARIVLQAEYDSALKRMDSLTGTNTKLQGELADRKSNIDKLKADIKKIIRDKNGDISEARAKINELNSQITDLLAEVDRLRGENVQLTAANQQLTTERDTLTAQKGQLQQNLTATTTEKEHLADVGSTLHASNININAIQIKSSGKEKETTTAKRADALRVSFQLDENRIASSGEKELYVCVTSPDGKIVSLPTKGSGSFQTRDEGTKTFTNKVVVQYLQGQRTPVSFDWKQDGQYQVGDYRIQIYQNGYKIGEGVKSLKKGGLFG